MTQHENMTLPKPTPDDRDRSPRDLPRAQGVRPSSDGGRPSNATNEIGSSSGFPGSHTVAGAK